MSRLIITADDLGIDPNINSAIVECYKQGLLTCSALLVNAPYSNEGIEIAKKYPNLEVGLHLSIVEGLSLRNIESTITDDIQYFNGICLIRDWKLFTKKYFLGKINFNELEEELELQILEFLKHFPKIPFINGTQHMHLLPKVWKIVVKLAKKYEINGIRVPSIEFPNSHYLNSRFLPLILFNILGQYNRLSLKKSNIKTTNSVIGMQYSGKISQDILVRIIESISKNSTSEIIMHPGYESVTLRQNLPWAYSSFNWDLERQALLSPKIKELIIKNNIELIKFSDL